MTDAEIKKALECHSEMSYDQNACEKCPILNHWDCGGKMAQHALDLINRQQAEIESVNKRADMWHREAELNAAELIKMQAEIERLKTPMLVIDNVNLSEDELREMIRKMPVQVFPDTNERIKAEAIKEFEEILKKHIESLEYNANTPRKTITVQMLYDQINWILKEVIPKTIDEALKEMVGETNG